MDEIAIRVNNVSKIFKLDKPLATNKSSQSKQQKKTLQVLDGISFTVSKGEILGIIGFNGSGKTTLLRIIAGIYKPTSGSVETFGRISPLLQLGTGFQGDLDARENVIMNGMLLGIPKSQMMQNVDSILEYAELKKFANMKLKNYSSGMKARLAFSASLRVNPDILLVDEILAVGDISFKEKSFNEFLSYKKKGKTVLYTTHSMSMLPKLCNRVSLIHNGKVDMIGKPDDVIKRYMELIASEKGVV